MAELFAVLADPSRLRLISALAKKELCVCDLAAALKMASLRNLINCGYCDLSDSSSTVVQVGTFTTIEDSKPYSTKISGLLSSTVACSMKMVLCQTKNDGLRV